jgi:hypothetical protein
VKARLLAEAIGDAAGDVIGGPGFPDAWEAANVGAYRSLISGSSPEWGQPVTLDLSPLAGQLQDAVDALELDLPADLAVDRRDLQIEMLDPATADQLRRALQELSLAFWGSLAVTVIALVLTIALAPDRLRALARAAFGLAIAMAALMGGLLIAQGAAVMNVAEAGGAAALTATMDAISQGLRRAAIGLAVSGLLLAAICFGLSALRGSNARTS